MSKRRRTKTRTPRYDGTYRWALLWGPPGDGDEDEELMARLRQLWERGGRDEIMSGSFRKPGYRPWGFWRFDFDPPANPDDYDCRCSAEWLIALNLVDDAEKKAILDGGVIDKQIAEDEREEQRQLDAVFCKNARWRAAQYALPDCWPPYI